MKYLDILRAERADIEAWRKAVVDALDAVASKAIDEKRSLSDDEGVEVESLRAEVAKIDDAESHLSKLNERIADLEAVEARTAAIADRPEVHIVRKEDPADVLEDRTATPSALADALTRAIEDKVEDPANMAHARSIIKRHAGDREWTRQMIVRASANYTHAWAKLVTGNGHMLTADEQRAALAVGTNANGGYLVPTHLDPSVILTNAGTSNVIRGMSRVVTLTTGNVWHGVSSAGATASWDGELVEVSDDSPTFSNPSVTPKLAQAFVQASLVSSQDIDGLANEVLMMLADARDRLEGTAHATGNGTTEPDGIFTKLGATGGSQVVSTTAATIGLVDLHALYAAVPVRWRGRSTWLANPTYTLAVKALGTAISASFSTDLTQGTAGTLLSRPVVESDDAPTTQTTTAKDPEMILGDFSNFVIVDMPGSTAVQYVPTLFNTANNLPDGRQGWFMQWRNGSDCVNTAAFRLLVDKTSA